MISIDETAFTNEHYLPARSADSIRKDYKQKSRLKNISVHQIVAEMFLAKPESV